MRAKENRSEKLVGLPPDIVSSTLYFKSTSNWISHSETTLHKLEATTNPVEMVDPVRILQYNSTPSQAHPACAPPSSNNPSTDSKTKQTIQYPLYCVFCYKPPTLVRSSSNGTRSPPSDCHDASAVTHQIF